MPIPALYAIAAAVLIGVGFAGGFSLKSKIDAGKIAQCKADNKTMLLEHERVSRQRMQDAAKSTEKALTYAMQRITEAEQQAEELRHEAERYTSGRDCLSTNARRVLEQSAAFSKQRVSENTGGADTALAAAPADTGDRTTTDTDIAQWAASASGLYEQCRSRVESIRQWNDGLAGRLEHGSD